MLGQNLNRKYFKIFPFHHFHQYILFNCTYQTRSKMINSKAVFTKTEMNNE